MHGRIALIARLGPHFGLGGLTSPKLGCDTGEFRVSLTPAFLGSLQLRGELIFLLLRCGGRSGGLLKCELEMVKW